MPASTTPPRHGPGEAARPFSIRLTEDERRLLAERAGRRPLGAYMRDVLLTRGGQAARQPRSKPVKDQQALARVLAALGQSRIASNLNQLAKAVNIGVLPAGPQTEADIRGACAAIAAIRRDLTGALGHQEDGSAFSIAEIREDR